MAQCDPKNERPRDEDYGTAAMRDEEWWFDHEPDKPRLTAQERAVLRDRVARARLEHDPIARLVALRDKFGGHQCSAGPTHGLSLVTRTQRSAQETRVEQLRRIGVPEEDIAAALQDAA